MLWLFKVGEEEEKNGDEAEQKVHVHKKGKKWQDCEDEPEFCIV